jgi:hypothetical protein
MPGPSSLVPSTTDTSGISVLYLINAHWRGNTMGIDELKLETLINTNHSRRKSITTARKVIAASANAFMLKHDKVKTADRCARLIIRSLMKAERN